ncbi:DUF2637 domain-containing protein [Streptomyces sp. SLBN-134]|uniref:DUF2637 domain-containing protein n=1 Tax=Streptomyces sp. SLBN-134 TaxID=2768456 RepID=UPI00114D5CFF|nr:DUF2637 domain-containing protein [Streptomyces sp. SLBN-134]TQL14688.1 uncharacterized protein DUF2637 [Streptomyces sp. SLBN-134]
MRKISTRAVLVTGAAIVATVAMAASADTLATLGGAVGWGREMKWSLPVSVDVLALVSGLVWLTAGLPEAARSLGRWLTLVTVGGSMVLNAIGHLVSTNHIVVGPPLVIAVSAVPPLAAALAVHLAAMTAQGGRGPKNDTAPVSVPAPADTIPAPADTPRVPVRVGADTGTDTADADDTARTETDTAALPADTIPAPADTGSVPVSAPTDTAPERQTYKLDTFAERYVPADAELTDPGTARPLVMPETGGRLTDAELDAVVVLLIRETDPPRSYRQMEDRFRELGYSASAARLRAAWGRVAAPAN